ncbi:MAG: hypothetical protein Q8Q90_00930 [bacterium]|nr:hypothetical protein [bacterium]
MHKLKIPGTWKLITVDGWEPEGLQYDYSLKREISSECRVPRLISPSGSFWEGKEKIRAVVSAFKNQKKRKG